MARMLRSSLSLLVLGTILQSAVGRSAAGFGSRLAESPFGISTRSPSTLPSSTDPFSTDYSEIQSYGRTSAEVQSEQHEHEHAQQSHSRRQRRTRRSASRHNERDYMSAIQCSSSRRSSSVKRSRSAKAAKTVIPASAIVMGVRPLVFWENMVCGAISRSIAQTVMHPANTMKTILQSSRASEAITFRSLLAPKMIGTLTRGAGANFVLSVPHGALNFAVLEFVRGRLNEAITTVPMLAARAESIGPGLDFMSSAISTICCSIVSTPQMMITDNIMAGNYPNLIQATGGLYRQRGVLGFYTGWWPGLVGKIPSYALTWTFFQQLKQLRDKLSNRPAHNYENTIMGCVASATTVCIMMPMDTIKTRLVTQGSAAAANVPYKGIIDCAARVAREEGLRTFYRGLAPRLISVVPMIGIQFGVYEAMKKVMLKRNNQKKKKQLMENGGSDFA